MYIKYNRINKLRTLTVRVNEELADELTAVIDEINKRNSKFNLGKLTRSALMIRALKNELKQAQRELFLDSHFKNTDELNKEYM